MTRRGGVENAVHPVMMYYKLIMEHAKDEQVIKLPGSRSSSRRFGVLGVRSSYRNSTTERDGGRRRMLAPRSLQYYRRDALSKKYTPRSSMICMPPRVRLCFARIEKTKDLEAKMVKLERSLASSATGAGAGAAAAAKKAKDAENKMKQTVAQAEKKSQVRMCYCTIKCCASLFGIHRRLPN